MYGWPTTRMYPRTLSSAFPKDPQNYEWFFPPEKNTSVANIVMAMVGLCLWAVALFLLTAP